LMLGHAWQSIFVSTDCC